MFEYSVNKKIELKDLIQLLFDTDSGNDQPCLDMLDGWLNIDELTKQFNSNMSSWSASPDLDPLKIEVISNKVLLTFEAGVVSEEGDINPDTAEFYINIDKSNIYRFVFYSEKLEV